MLGSRGFPASGGHIFVFMLLHSLVMSFGVHLVMSLCLLTLLMRSITS